MTRCLGTAGEPEPLGSSTKISHEVLGEAPAPLWHDTISNSGPLLGIRDQTSKKMVV